MRLWLPVMTLCQRELVRFWREKGRVLGLVASPLVFWLLIGSGYGNLGFFFPGALVLTVMFSAISSTITIIEDRREGFLLSMLGYHRHIRAHQRNMAEYRKIVMEQDKGAWRIDK